MPIEVDDGFALLAVVFRTARIARFVQSAAAQDLASRMQWLLQLWWVPRKWFRAFRPCRRKRDRAGDRAEVEGRTDGGNFHNTSRTAVTSQNVSQSSSLGVNTRGVEPPSHMRRSSWGGLGMSVLAAVRANEHTESGRRGRWQLLSGWRQSNNNERFRRELAARKIQRAWRAAAYDSDDMTSHHNDVAWDAASPSRNTAVDKALFKKNLLRQHQNTRFRGRVSYDTGRLRPSVARRRSQFLSLATLESRREVKVGDTMRERTGQRVALGIMLTLIVTMLFTYAETDATRPTSMVVLHSDTSFERFANQSLDSARARAIPDLFEYQFRDGSIRTFNVDGEDVNSLRPRDIIHISVQSEDGRTEGYFAFRQGRREIAVVSLLATFFILCLWFFGVTAFAGPVMMLVVIPIERMVRLLSMLMRDPLGYQTHLRYKKFVAEEKALTKNTRWTQEILKGMETSFLMSTILRIGNLLKVGFGSAGVEIIRKNLGKNQARNMLDLNSQGSTVSCIFLFCDIRQFTDATECLQEEVFVFTNKIAAVVHSICHAYGGAANKNVGDAFLLSWLLDGSNATSTNVLVNGSPRRAQTSTLSFSASKNQADKALLSVVKICISLHYDDYYIESMTDHARRTLLAKLSNRQGPVVQMGFGLHAGSAVQGAIGSQRKIDATFVSDTVEMAEFLESSTKKYGVPLLMSDNFHRLLQAKTRGRCRKIDQIRITSRDDEEAEEEEEEEDFGGSCFPFPSGFLMLILLCLFLVYRCYRTVYFRHGYPSFLSKVSSGRCRFRLRICRC